MGRAIAYTINAILQDNSIRYVACRVLTCIALEDGSSRCLVRSSYLSPIENIWPWIAETVGSYRSPNTTIDKVWRRLEVSWNDIPASYPCPVRFNI
ncbi:hypothetical protein TNCV_3309751 [Trichonephila clavipes]|nr:hypothetical protein TNCV_3309751 [Trichonephila clavipes]